jgi:hypothetical protein
MQEMEMQIQKTENRRCKLHPARAKVCMSIPSPTRSTHSLIERAKGRTAHPSSKPVASGPVDGVRERSCSTPARIPTLHTHRDLGALASCERKRERGDDRARSSVTERGSVDAEGTNRFLLKRKAFLWSATGHCEDACIALLDAGARRCLSVKRIPKPFRARIQVTQRELKASLTTPAIEQEARFLRQRVGACKGAISTPSPSSSSSSSLLPSLTSLPT